jgi:hypothetical protein
MPRGKRKVLETGLLEHSFFGRIFEAELNLPSSLDNWVNSQGLDAGATAMKLSVGGMASANIWRPSPKHDYRARSRSPSATSHVSVSRSAPRRGGFQRPYGRFGLQTF